MHSLPPSQRGRCSDCGADQVALVHHTHVQEFRNSTRKIEWDECFGCYSKAEARALQLKQEADADRAAKLPPAPERKRRSTGLPFIDQIEVGE